MFKIRSLFILLAGVALVAPCLAQQSPAQPPAAAGQKTAPATTKPTKKSNPVYACNDCKMAFSHNAAKVLKMKCPMGHGLVKMDKLPDGFKMQTKADLKAAKLVEKKK